MIVSKKLISKQVQRCIDRFGFSQSLQVASDVVFVPVLVGFSILLLLTFSTLFALDWSRVVSLKDVSH